MSRTAKDKELDLNNVETEVGQLPLRIGVIPSGTGQGCIKMLTGRYDPITAAMHIILGDNVELSC